MLDDVLQLIGQSYEKDPYGVEKPTNKPPREVFVQVGSVTRREFFDAGRNGLNPEFVFTLFNGDYQGESVCAYRGQSYAIYRTYRVPDSDYIELYVERKGGTNGKENVN